MLFNIIKKTQKALILKCSKKDENGHFSGHGLHIKQENIELFKNKYFNDLEKIKILVFLKS